MKIYLVNNVGKTNPQRIFANEDPPGGPECLKHPGFISANDSIDFNSMESVKDPYLNVQEPAVEE